MAKQQYDISSRHRMAVQERDQINTKITALDSLESEIEDEYRRVIASGDLDNIEQINKASACQVKLAMIGPKRAQLKAQLPAHETRIQEEAARLKLILGQAAGLTREAFIEKALDMVTPLYSDPQARMAAAGRAFQESDAGREMDVNFRLDHGRMLFDAAPETVLALLALIQKFAPLLPKDFWPFPKNEKEYIEGVPERLRPGYTPPTEDPNEGKVWDTLSQTFMTPEEYEKRERKDAEARGWTVSGRMF